MKKISLLFATLLVLVSSIVFCSCNDGYKKLKIECNVEQINLVLDDNELSQSNLTFKLSGAKSWGEVSIVSVPSGHVQVVYQINDKQCNVAIKALQPTGDGASLVITHLGSGKSLSVPLNIGQKLQTLESKNQEFIIQAPTFSLGDVDDNGKPITVKEIEIPTKKLVSGQPSNYTDTIVWQSKVANLDKGVKVVSYDKNGNRLDSTFQATSIEQSSTKSKGQSNAVRSVIEISEGYDLNQTIVINPISILKGEAILHKDIDIEVSVVDLLSKEEIALYSVTHGNEMDVLKDLVLISNPDPDNPRVISTLAGYDYYSTAIIDVRTIVKRYTDWGDLYTVYENISEVNSKFEDLYQINMSSNLDGLLLENVEFGKIRVIATSTCVGTGTITIQFNPKDCVGDIEGFTISVSCTVGERATSFKVSNNGLNVETIKLNEYSFRTTTPLNDATSLGQPFKFEMLSTSTLSAFTKYKITIDKNLLHINTDNVDKTTNTSRYIKSYDGEDNLDLTDLLIETNKYEYQIEMLKDGREITFYEDNNGNFVSEPLTSKQTIYMKWLQTGGKALDIPFGISVSNFYDESYKIDDSGFEDTAITLNIEFNRQRTVESISYVPVKVTLNPKDVQEATDAGNDWQFYFEPTMLDSVVTYYGIEVLEVFGLNSSQLTPTELKNINLNLSVDDSNLGFALFSGNGPESFYINNYIFNFDSDVNNYDRNIILIGKLPNSEVKYGDYQIKITQNGTLIDTKDVKLYKTLTEEEVEVSVPAANFDGEMLQYTLLDTIPSDWNTNYASYYEFAGGQYVPVTSNAWNDNKSYYQKNDIAIVYELLDVVETPSDWYQYNRYYEIIDGKYVLITSGDWDESKTYYKKNNMYILATSSQYLVNIEIKNKDFVSLSGQEVTSSIVSASNKATLDNSYLKSLTGKDAFGNDIIKTSSIGSFNATTGEQNYIKLTYTINTNTYDYYKLNQDMYNPITKVIYIYIYEPITSATFDSTMLYKYDYKSITNEQQKQEYGTETLTIKLNNGSQSVLNYVDIKWTITGDAASFKANSNASATLTFTTGPLNMATGRIIATLTQYGIQYPIYCGYEVNRPILSEQVILDTTINAFKSGGGYINLKAGETFQVEASTKSSKGEVSFEGVTYIICSTTGYAINSVAQVDSNGVITALNAGRAKLIIIPTDRLTTNLSSIINYFSVGQYVENAEHIIIDIIVSDGSENNPYLIASGDDFRAIKDDVDKGVKDKHYALVNDIDLNGQSFSIKEFEGTISSYGTSNTFTIYGVMLDESNPNLFKVLNARDDDLAVLSNINFHIDINYISKTIQNSDILIGLVGVNNALIENITITISGQIDAKGINNDYIIGSMVATNTATGIINIIDDKLVGVKGDITVSGGGRATVVLGGVIGRNEGKLQGANISSSKIGNDGQVKYEVYYDNQGATADVVLRVKSVYDLTNSAIGGVIGFNADGVMAGVYSMGRVLGQDDANNLTVDNVGGLIGKNYNVTNIVSSSVTIGSKNDIDSVSTVTLTSSQFQITNSYSSAQVAGNTNVGGAVGYDERGAYQKVYYEIYEAVTSIKGDTNVGGLIGYTKDSSLEFCYANSFAWNYKDSVDIYDISGTINVGGLIGLAQSSRTASFTDSYETVTIVRSLASVSLTGIYNVSGLVGRLSNFGAIYTTYFYGVIDTKVSVINSNPITKMYDKNNNVIGNIPYNNVYAIVNGEEVIQITDNEYFQGTGFSKNTEYNNGKPYIVYTLDDGGINLINLVSVIPTIVQVNKAFYYEDSEGNYVWSDILGEFVKYDETLHLGEQRYSIKSLYREYAYGEYVSVNNEYVPYNNQAGKRYTLMASVVDTGDTDANLSDYRKSALVLYYYPFSDMSGENALNDYYALNTVDMKDIVDDEGIIVLPNTFKRFNLRSSDSNIVTVLSGGKLLLQGEGQATITLISTLNPNATASFVVIVRSKVLEFGLYTNANMRDEYNIQNPENSTINIIKNTSKLIYADYASSILTYNRNYEYNSATNMIIDFEVAYEGSESITDITKYITLNKDYYTKLDADGNVISSDDTTTPVAKYVYRIPYGTPITISVHEYIDGKFNINATPYVVANYKNGDYSKAIVVELSSYFDTRFEVVTKKGASAINTDKNQLDMMPADDASKVNVKITTDVEQDKLYFDIEAIGEIYQVLNPINPQQAINLEDTIDVALTFKVDGQEVTKPFIRDEDGKYFDISGIDLSEMAHTAVLTLKLNDSSYYIDDAYKLQIDLYVFNGTNTIGTRLFINVEPQAITSLIALNYRMEDSATSINLKDAYQSQIIRPGSTNIIAIDIAPAIAVYDYVEIVDITTEDKILLQQVYKQSDGSLKLPGNMDTWVDNGVQLIKQNVQTSTLYIFARLPQTATANITHTLQITAYDKNGNVLISTPLSLEAIMYPTVIMTYTYPNGDEVEVDTRRGEKPQQATGKADLAVGVEAGIVVNTINIDEDTLKHSITITSGADDVTEKYINLVRLEQMYGKYVLTFDTNNQSEWTGLIGKQINVTFEASKSLNGITETCYATIEFTIYRMVIHSVSMTHTTSNGELYGDWGEEFITEFYFDKTDISYYSRGYWNVEYTLDNTNPTNLDNGVYKNDMQVINNILRAFNTVGSDAVEIFFVNKNINNTTGLTPLTKVYKDNAQGISIVNEDNKYIISAKEGSNINDMKIMVNFKLEYNNNFYPILSTNAIKVITNIFGFNITKETTPFDEYITISTQAEFENMIEGKYYQLANNIILTDYSPLNTAIGGLNGDGYTITIENQTKGISITDGFNVAQLEQNYLSGGMYIGLFGILAEDSVVQNLQVYYADISINLDRSAIQEQNTNNVYFGGIAGQNLGVITNVRVFGSFTLKAQYISAKNIDLGGITAINGSSDSVKVATITGSDVELDMKAMALIGGVSGTNYGKITNTNFKGSITSKDSNQYVAEVTTAGFVVENLNGGYISLSYVESEIALNGYNIQSVGRTAGFVLNNTGTISNCYISQISISSQGNIGGFVYQSTGEINNSYAYATLGNSLFYNEFIYSTTNVGTITNCYVVTDSDRNIYVSGLTKLTPAQIANKDNFVGFVFAKTSNGVWSTSSYGPKLQNSGFNSNKDEYDDIFNIYDVETYEGFFATNIDTIEGKTFRLVRDIDFVNDGLEGNPVTFNKTLLANLEGNDMALKNYNIYRSGEMASIGLFASIGNSSINVYVRNLILEPASVKATNGSAVGALAGTIDSAMIYNIRVDNEDLLILGKNSVGGLAGIIKGNFEVIGVSSNVSAFATYVHNTDEQYNLYTGKNVTGNTLLNNIGEVSYTGAIAGIADGYNSANTSMIIRNIDSYYTISNVTINGDLVLIGETVGGAFGLVGERTLINYLNYNLSNETKYQGVYVSGGLVGENRGIVQNSNIYAYDTDKQRIDTTACFDNFARINGAIVGNNIGGLINKCSSDINVSSTKNLATVGGIVGRNIEGSVYNCSVSGTVKGFFVGGIAGTDYSYKTIINQNSGHGVATYATSIVYKNIQNKVEYTLSIVSNYVKGQLYGQNILTDNFVDKFVSSISNYYSFNNNYMENNTNNLVDARSLFGLVIGLTDSSYETKISCSNTQSTTTYTDMFVVTLIRGTSSDVRPELEYSKNNKTQTINPITNIIAEDFVYTSDVVFLYIIAYDNGSYDAWTSTLGYTNEYIVVSPEELPLVTQGE